MQGKLDVLYQAIRPLEIEAKGDRIIERYNYRHGTLTFDGVAEDTWLVDEREYTLIEFIAHNHEAKMWLEDTVTRLELALHEICAATGITIPSLTPAPPQGE